MRSGTGSTACPFPPFSLQYAAHAVVECYREWAGPCKSVVSTLKSLYFSMSERPIKFYTVRVWAAPRERPPYGRQLIRQLA